MNAVPLHMLLLSGVVSVGLGRTVTVTSSVLLQPSTVVVYRYVTVLLPLVVLNKYSLTFPVPLPDSDNIPATYGRLQLKVAPLVPVNVADGVYANNALSQIKPALCAELRAGVGFTDTVMLCVLIQPWAWSVST